MRRRRALLFLGAWLAAGCAASGGALEQRAAPAPTSVEERHALTDIDALEHDLAVAEERLNDQIGRKQASLGAGSASATTGTAAGASPTTPPAQPGGTAPRGEPPADKAGRSAEAPPATAAVPPSERGAVGDSTAPAPVSGSPCDLACRALASMKRSAARIAELAGADDPRTIRANERVAAAADRVARAGCACRSDPG